MDSGGGGTEATAFIQFINGQEPHIYEFWCLGLDGISRKVHPTDCVEVTAGTVRDFVNDYLAENGCIVKIIGKNSINDRVQFLGLSDQTWGSGLPFIFNLLAHVEAIGWGSAIIPNRTVEGGPTTLTALQMPPGLIPLTPIRLTCR